MKIVISKEEIEKVKKYCLFADTNPCRGCASNDGFCCGCSKRIAWEATDNMLRNETKDIIGADCPEWEWEIVEKYCQTEISLSKLREQMAQLNQQILKTAHERDLMLDRQIEIKEDTKNDD